jgi:hypothetical protein
MVAIPAKHAAEVMSVRRVIALFASMDIPFVPIDAAAARERVAVPGTGGQHREYRLDRDDCYKKNNKLNICRSSQCAQGFFEWTSKSDSR